MSELPGQDRRGPAAAANAGERGSVYLFVLLGLLVLTIVGLSLVVVTQTEAQIGGAEKSAVRAMYGAESGLHIQVGLHFLQLDPAGARFELDESTAGETITGITQVVDVSPYYPIYAGPCALCSVNVGSEQRYYVNNYAVNSEALRFRSGAGGCAETPQAQKLLSAMFMIQPEPQPGGGVDDSIRTYDPDRVRVDNCQPGLVEILY
jgi:Tfp pilus assembly protein PilX